MEKKFFHAVAFHFVSRRLATEGAKILRGMGFAVKITGKGYPTTVMAMLDVSRLRKLMDAKIRAFDRQKP